MKRRLYDGKRLLHVNWDLTFKAQIIAETHLQCKTLTVKVSLVAEGTPEARQARDLAGGIVAREMTQARVFVCDARSRCRWRAFRRQRKVRLLARRSAKTCFAQVRKKSQ